MKLTSETLIEFATAQAAGLSTKDRFERLLATLASLIECDAIALLSLQGEILKPLAIKGLTPDTLGRRFNIEQHPRLTIICDSKVAVRFSSESPLPDPYDGLLAEHKGDLPIHACMGLPLYFAEKLIGVLTFDSLDPSAFEELPQDKLAVLAAIAASSLQIALTLDELEVKNAQSHLLVEELNKDSLSRDNSELIGESTEMRKLKKEISLVSASPFSVLIHGETGVGKELVAKNIHLQSPRAGKPLVHVNCAALPENLIESELFGHVKGAFTGADRDRAGKFLLANGGTIFLDEIGELPLIAQSKLLRVLQSQEIQPVGQDNIEYVDVRVVAATNRDLAEEVKQGRFRADLFHRLSVYPLSVPALRNRYGDIELLAGFLIEQSRRKLGFSQLKLSISAMGYLTQYGWPGNVRELEHVLARAALKAAAEQSDKDVITIEIEHCGDLNSAIIDESIVGVKRATNPEINDSSDVLGFKEKTENYQRSLIQHALMLHENNWSAAARVLKTDRSNLIRLAKRLGITVTKTVVFESKQ